MIVHFNKENVVDSGGKIHVRGRAYYSNPLGGASEGAEIVFMIPHEVLEHCVGDHRGYWQRLAYVLADENWPIITEACAYAMTRIPADAEESNTYYLEIMSRDFPGRVRVFTPQPLPTAKDIILTTLKGWPEDSSLDEQLAEEIHSSLVEAGYL